MSTGCCFWTYSMILLLERSFSASWCEWWTNWNTTSHMGLLWTTFLKMTVFAAKICTTGRYDSSALVNVSSSVSLALPSACLRKMLILVVSCFGRSAVVLWLYEISYNLMVIDLVHFNLIKGPQDFNIFLKDLVFQNRGHGWRMVLLETHDHVAYKGTLGGQKCTTTLQSHRMPHFAVLNTILFRLATPIGFLNVSSTLLGFGAFSGIELFAKKA